MPSGEDERNEVALGGGRLAPKAESGAFEGYMHPSVGRFTANKIPFSLDVNGPPLGVRTNDIAARSIAPTCNYGVFNTQVLERPMKGSYGTALTKCTQQSPRAS